jgi:murein DD-endopeptidase MepM/ murein hydrolase activator NlpD
LWPFLHAATASAQPFFLPTANRAIYDLNGQEKYFAGTEGKDWQSGTFGCVRSGGFQMHEGIDIRCLQRDKKGEPTDPVLATADGTVVYFNRKPSLSNYGNYLVIRHKIEGLEIYSLYAHLSEIRDDLKKNQTVKAGEQIGVMGRTSNTHQRISQDRAHVHFELNLYDNDHFSKWYEKNLPDQRNDHGDFNGINLLGLDPRLILLKEKADGPRFSLLDFIRNQTELCRVIVRKTDFPWIHRYAALVRKNPTAEKEGVAGYELALNFNAIAFELIPRAESEIKGKAKYQLVSVNEAEARSNPARRLVSKSGSHWVLATHGIEALDLLTF